MSESVTLTAQPKQGSVLKNTLILVGAQFLGMPLSIVVNAALGRKLGPTDFGYLNLAGTFCTFGFLFVEWGHGGLLPAAIAQNRDRAGALLGSSLAWRVGSAVVVTLLMLLGAWFFYPAMFLPILALAAGQNLLGLLGGAYQDAARGYERTDVTAIGRIGSQLINVFVVLPILLLGYGLLPCMVAGLVGALLILPLIINRTHAVGVPKAHFDRNELQRLTREGRPFLVFSTAMTLQGVVDAVSLSKLSTPEVFGWNSAAQKLVGTLIIPAGALVASLYPTLSRLIVEDPQQYKITLRRAINGTGLLSIPLGLGCAFYADLGIAIYGKAGYGPAAQNLVATSLMVLLFYFSMPLGSALLAAGRQAAWAWAQTGCVVVRLLLNPFLIPWFQKHYGNGGIGVCISGSVCELGLVVVAMAMLPRDVIDRALAKVLGKGVLSGCAMAGVAYGLARVGLTPWVAAPIAVLVYFGALFAFGGVDMTQLDRVTSGIRSKLSRKRG